MSYACLDEHLAAAGSIDRAAVPLGMFVAFCANHSLMSREFAAAHETLLLRLRYREITGSELLVAGCGGCLEREHLSAAGQAFADSYLPRFMTDFERVFGGDVYGVEDSWRSYDQLAPVLARALAGKRGEGGGAAQASNGREEKRWWQIWR